MTSHRWILASPVNDIPEDGTGRRVKVDGLEIAVFRWNHSLYAIENFCPHLGFPLTEGVVRDGAVICGWHGWRVRLADGGCHGKTSTARTFRCEVRVNDLYVEIPEAPPVDDSLQD